MLACIGNLGSGTGGRMKTRCARGGGAPCLAGSSVWLLPPECCSTAFEWRRGNGARGKTWCGLNTGGGETMECEVTSNRIATAATWSPIESVCDLAVGMTARMQFANQRVTAWDGTSSCGAQ